MDQNKPKNIGAYPTMEEMVRTVEFFRKNDEVLQQWNEQIAKNYRQIFIALTKQGFDSDQALELIKHRGLFLVGGTK